MFFNHTLNHSIVASEGLLRRRLQLGELLNVAEHEWPMILKEVYELIVSPTVLLLLEVCEGTSYAEQCKKISPYTHEVLILLAIVIVLIAVNKNRLFPNNQEMHHLAPNNANLAHGNNLFNNGAGQNVAVINANPENDDQLGEGYHFGGTPFQYYGGG